MLFLHNHLAVLALAVVRLHAHDIKARTENAGNDLLYNLECSIVAFQDIRARVQLLGYLARSGATLNALYELTCSVIYRHIIKQLVGFQTFYGSCGSDCESGCPLLIGAEDICAFGRYLYIFSRLKTYFPKYS